MIMDSTMSFGNQIKSLVNKCLRTIEFVKKVSLDFSTASALVELYKFLLLPMLTFCSPTWLPHSGVALGELLVVEHTFMRFVSRLRPLPMCFDDHDM